MHKKYYNQRRSFGGVSGRERYSPVADFAKESLNKQLKDMLVVLFNIEQNEDNKNNFELKKTVTELKSKIYTMKKDLESLGVLDAPCKNRVENPKKHYDYEK